MVKYVDEKAFVHLSNPIFWMWSNVYKIYDLTGDHKFVSKYGEYYEIMNEVT